MKQDKSGNNGQPLLLASIAGLTSNAKTFLNPIHAGRKIRGQKNTTTEASKFSTRSRVSLPRITEARRSEIITEWQSAAKVQESYEASDPEFADISDEINYTGNGSIVGQILSKAVSAFIRSQVGNS